MRGMILRALSGFFTVHADGGDYVCQLRGKLKSGKRTGDLAAIGDWVEFSPVEEPVGLEKPGVGMIDAIEDRTRMLSRMDPTPRGELRQIIVANLDQAVFVFACKNPQPHLAMLDRFLVIAESQSIPVTIVANKVDLLDDADAHALFGFYPQLGYPVIYTSVKQGRGIRELSAALSGKISAFAGPSGVGKSSLLNAIQPGLGLAVREVSQMTRKGRHTTVGRQLFPLNLGGYIADTPGLKALAFWDIHPEELDGYFPEIRSRVAQCAYNDCRHVDEPGCAVTQAVAAGDIQPGRYRAYLNMRFGREEEGEE